MSNTNKIALITGGSRGLGRNMAECLAADGHDVIITYVSQEEEAEKVAAAIAASGRKAAALRLDVGDTISFDAFITALKALLDAKFGAERLDFLINNAGIGGTIPFMTATEEDFDRFNNVHYKGVYFLTQKALPLINDGGRIVNLSSGTTRFVNPGYSIYASMKGAVETLTKYWAKEFGARQITVNIVAPGPVETDFNNAFIRSNPEVKARLGQVTALGRVGVAEDIGPVVSFLCSEGGRWISGQRIEASGGINL